MLRIEHRAGQELASRLQPVLREARLQRHDRRTGETESAYHAIVRAIVLDPPDVGDARATGECDPAVDDERLAVCAV
jgi:hypothetical protein